MDITKEEIIELVEQVFDNNIYSIGENTILGIETSIEGKSSFLSELEELLNEKQTNTEVDKQHDIKELNITNVNTNNSMQKITEDIIKDIHNKQEVIIRKKIKEIVGIDIDLKEEQKRRFKRFIIEYNGNEEIVYFNDGSIEGKRIVTFVRNKQPINFSNTDFKIIMNYSYY